MVRINVATEKGYIYVLIHPSDPNLVKVGKTVLDPKQRLKQHNTQLDKAAGRIVKETGDHWVLKEYFEVEDAYFAESVFWQRPPLTEIVFKGKEEVLRLQEGFLDWNWVEDGLDAVRKAGVRKDNSQPPKGQVIGSILTPKQISDSLSGTGLKPVRTEVDGKLKLCYECEKGHLFFVPPKLAITLTSCPLCNQENASKEVINDIEFPD